MLRALLPSWRFFDEAAPVPCLSYRWAREDGTFGPWRAWEYQAPRTLLTLLHNPRGNLRLAYASLLERLVADLAELDEGDAAGAARLVSYELVVLLLRRELHQLADRGARFQFKLTLEGGLTVGSDGPDGIEVLSSALHEP